MEPFERAKDDLLKISTEIQDLVDLARELPAPPTETLDGWECTCRSAADQLAEETVRVAVVGAIKSGKSTFTNALFGGDYVKRGAGVVTSIVTRIRRRAPLQARLIFKSWDEVNADIGQAAQMLPALDAADAGPLDIRRSGDRQSLSQALAGLGAEQTVSGGRINVGSMLLRSYLEGFEAVHEYVGADGSSTEFGRDRFAEHRRFVSNDSLAVYLRDVLLEIDAGDLDGHIEIADCQGSDSPNPLHLAMIQDYLVRTHLLVYVVSSRTGLRQADIRFISMIREMGIAESVMFVVNCDFSEHESLQDLQRLGERVADETALVHPEPEIYSFSTLYNLFARCEGDLGVKDRKRLEQWRIDTEMTAYSDAETARFRTAFHHRLSHQRYALLLKNHMERLRLVADGLHQWTGTARDLLGRDEHQAHKILTRLAAHQARTAEIGALIRRTLDGVVQQVKQELRRDIDRYFDDRNGPVIERVVGFIRGYNPPLDKYAAQLDGSGFAGTLYFLYQDFQQALQAVMAATVNPMILGFIRDQERQAVRQIGLAAVPYAAMIGESLEDHRRMLDGFGLPAVVSTPEAFEPPEAETVRRHAALELPPAVASMRFSARVKTEAVMRLGVYTVANWFRRMFRKSEVQAPREGIQALQAAAVRLKRETEGAVRFGFRSYRENLKFQYVFKLADATGNQVYSRLMERFQSHSADLTRLREAVGDHDADRDRDVETLERVALAAAGLVQRLEEIRRTIEVTLEQGGGTDGIKA